MRRLTIALVLVAGLLWWIPGEVIVQCGLQKVAFEQGVALARRHHSWEASADADSQQTAQIAPATARKGSRK